MKGIRESFAAKLFSGLLGTVGVLLVVTWAVVRAETDLQVREVTEQAVATAADQLARLEEIQRRQLERVARPLTEGSRTLAALDEAIETQDRPFLTGQAEYQLRVAQLDDADVVVAFTDARARPVLTMHGSVPLGGADPAGLGPVARRILDGEAEELQSYRVMDGALFSVRTRLIDLANRPIGTLSLGFPIRDADVLPIGLLVGVEVCFVVESGCVAGTPLARGELAGRLAGMGGVDEAHRAELLGREWFVRAQPLLEGDPAQGSRVIAVPLDEVLAPFARITRALLLGGVLALLLAVLVGVGLSRGLTRPVRALVDATGRVARGEYETRVSVASHDELRTLADAFNDMTRGLLLKERYRSVLDKVVSRDVAEELIQGKVELGGENRRVTVLFADIRGFSPLTEGMEPQEVIGLLNECMERLSQAVDDEGGVVDKYVGDELMAVFGVPMSAGEDALRAVRAAVRMQDAMAELNRRRAARGDAPIGLGVGVNTGEVVAGNMGSRNRLNYTVLGDAVNLGARLCAGAAAGEILVTAETLRETGAGVVARSLGPRSFKGFSAEVEVFAVERTGPEGAGRPAPAGRAMALALAASWGAALGAAGPAAAQTLPTLRDLGAEWVSAAGAAQLTLSGQLDVEGLAFQGTGAGLARGDGFLVAPRLRVFADLFLGDHAYGLVEVRGDRGEAPTAGAWEGRVEQAFLRMSSRSGSLSLQVGRFASPFGSYALRHLTEADPFVRPPLPYDYRTVMCPGIAPPNAARFLAWRDDPDFFRPRGAPPVWGVPYQWGAMVAGSRGAWSYRLATMSGAPSSGPGAWGLDGERLRHPSVVAGIGVRIIPALTLGASWDRGPWLEELERGTLPPGVVRWGYLQELVSVDVSWARGPVTARAEVVRDRWDVPNVADSPVEWGASAEVQADLAAGVWAAVRAGALDFRPVDDGAGTREWDHDMRRYEVSAGYRVARNAGLLASWSVNDQRSSLDPADDLVAVRLWWAF